MSANASGTAPQPNPDDAAASRNGTTAESDSSGTAGGALEAPEAHEAAATAVPGGKPPAVQPPGDAAPATNLPAELPPEPLPPAEAVQRGTRPNHPLQSRIDWNAALERQADISARYGRPASVAVLELQPTSREPSTEGWLRREVWPLGELVLRNTRTSDVVARVASTRFHVLLPETDEATAKMVVGRIVATCQDQVDQIGAPLRIHAGVAGASTEAGLRDAISRAVGELDAVPA